MAKLTCPISTFVSPELRQQLDWLAEQRGTSLSYIVRQAIQAGMKTFPEIQEEYEEIPDDQPTIPA